MATTPDRAEVRRRSARPAAAWLAVSGCVLLMIAAIIVVAGRWGSIPPSARLTGLLAAGASVFAVAERFKRRIPTTARATAFLAIALCAPIGVAAAATFGGTWPVCLVVGGALAAVISDVQSRRWVSFGMLALGAGAIAVGAAGVAAITGVPVAVLVGAIAVAFVALGMERRATMLAALAALGPVLAAIGRCKVGPGTIRRLGASGEVLAWAAPVAGLLGAAVFAVVAHRHRSIGYVRMSIASAVLGAIVGLGSANASTITWACVPAGLVLLVELTAAFGADSVWAHVARRATRWTTPYAFVGIGAGIVAIAVRYEAPGSAADRWTLPLVLSTLAAAAVATRLGRDRSARVHPATMGAAGWLCATLAGHAGSRTTAEILVLGGITCLGLAFVTERFTPLDTVGLSALVLGTLCSFGAHTPPLVSVAFVALSAAGLSYGYARRSTPGSIAGTLALVGSITSLWWTAGVGDDVLASLHRHGLAGTDLVVVLVAALLLGLGWIGRRSVGFNSWIADGPGLGLLSAWLIVHLVQGAETWPLVGAIGLGVAAMAVGGIQRLAAPLIMGTGLTGTAIVFASRAELASLPPWSWIVAGGVLLLGLAYLIERQVGAERPGSETVLESLRSRFG